MPARMLQCTGERDGVRCARRNKVITFKGEPLAQADTWKCESCTKGEAPYSPRSSARKGQQKQVKKK